MRTPAAEAIEFRTAARMTELVLRLRQDDGD